MHQIEELQPTPLRSTAGSPQQIRLAVRGGSHGARGEERLTDILLQKVSKSVLLTLYIVTKCVIDTIQRQKVSY